MSLTERLANPPEKKSLDVWLQQLNDQDRAAVIAAVKDRTTWGRKDLLNALVDEGAPDVPLTTFGAWRERIERANS